MSKDNARMFTEAELAEEVWQREHDERSGNEQLMRGFQPTGGQPTPEAVVEAHNEAMGLASEKTRYILTHPWRFHCGFILCDDAICAKPHVVVCCTDRHVADYFITNHHEKLRAFDPEAARESEVAG